MFEEYTVEVGKVYEGPDPVQLLAELREHGEAFYDGKTGGIIPHDHCVYDEDGRVVMIAPPHTQAMMRTVAEKHHDRRRPRDRKKGFRVAKDLYVSKPVYGRERTQEFWDRFLDGPDQADYEGWYWAEQQIRQQVTRNIQRDLVAFMERAVA